MIHKHPAGLFSYAVDRGDGRWLLMKDGEVQRGTPGTELSFAYDRSCGTLHKHGNPDMVTNWVDGVKAKLENSGAAQLAADLKVLTVNSYPLVGGLKPHTIYLSEDDANAIISTSGYILKVLAKLDAIDVEVCELPTDSPT